MFQDFDKYAERVREEHIDWSEPFNELELEEYSGLARFCSYHANP